MSSLGVAAVVMLLTGCMAHERNGDRAAALGDWKTALQEYREGLSKEPGSAKLKEKYDRARVEASKGAFQKAQACAARENWACAVDEADFALTVDEGNSEIAAFRVDAAKALGLSLLRDADEASVAGQFSVAFEKLSLSTNVSSDPLVAQEAQRVRNELVRATEAEADRLHAEKSLGRAVELMHLVASVDGSKSGKLEALRREYEAYLAAEYERHARNGDLALEQKNWAEAEQHYLAAESVRAGGRAAGLAEYTGAIARGEVAISARDFTAATDAFNRAIATGADSSGYARQMLEAVEVRPYAIRIKSLLVKSLRPDGQPWVGERSPALGRLIKVAASYLAPGAGTVIASAVVDAAEAVPPENRPAVRVEVTVPDGRKLTTPTKKSLYLVYDSEVILDTNRFDERKLSFKVVGEGDNVDDVGVIEIPLKDLVAQRELGLSDQSILSLSLVAEPVSGKVDGMFSALAPHPDSTNVSSEFSVPTVTSRGYRLTGVDARAASADVPAEALDGAPDLYVKIQQGERAVFVSAFKSDAWQASWLPTGTFFFVEPNENLTVSLWDRDLENDDLIFYAQVNEQAIASGQVEVATPAGSFFRLKFENRQNSASQLQAVAR